MRADYSGTKCMQCHFPGLVGHWPACSLYKTDVRGSVPARREYGSQACTECKIVDGHLPSCSRKLCLECGGRHGIHRGDCSIRPAPRNPAKDGEFPCSYCGGLQRHNSPCGAYLHQVNNRIQNAQREVREKARANGIQIVGEM